MLVPRWYQSESVAAFWDALCSRPGLAPVIVLPTGAGKSIVIAMLCKEAMEKFGGRVVVLAHRKELVEQNAEKIRAAGLAVGVYSAGLGSRDLEHDVLVAGIQSVYKRAHEIGQRHLVLVDEGHLVPGNGEGMYLSFLADLRKYNPRVRLGGLTATPFRMDCGPLCHPDRIFHRVCYSAPIRRLMEERFLCPIVTRVEGGFDTSHLHTRAGEFVAHEAEALFGGDDAKVMQACREIVARTQERRSVLVFCAGVRHAEKVASTITQLTGDICGLVTGETDALSRHSTLSEFKTGNMKYVANVDVLTTGFDSPGIDCIAILRATASPGLFAQVCGRGFRRSLGKADCLILDFGENFKRHGALDDPAYGHVPGRSNPEQPGEAPTKYCPNCAELLAAAATECRFCGFAFPREVKHGVTPDEDAQVLLEPERWDVVNMVFNRHVKKNNPDAPNTLRVDYLCQREGAAGNLTKETISEWVCLEHEGFALKKAEAWWSQHCREPFVADIDEAIYLFDRGAFATPRKLVTQKEGKFYRVTSRDILSLPEVLEGDAAEGNDPAPPDEWFQPSAEVPF